MTRINKHSFDKVTIEDVEKHKIITDAELRADLESLRCYSSENSPNSSCGNKFLYHHQLVNLMHCRREKAKTMYDLSTDEWNKLIEETIKRNRGGKSAAGDVFECFRVNKGSVVMFKSAAAKYLYQKYGATSVLDPTAGWGGRMLGAWAADVSYTGIDTNTNMKPAYDEMMKFIRESKTPSLFYNEPDLNMIWEPCLDVDFSKIDYDFVLTSPPYVNIEVYEHMEEWSSDEAFYKEFFIPLWQKCVDNIKRPGTVCFNISPKMYNDALKYDLPVCDTEEHLGQQKKKSLDKIYIWTIK